MSNHPTGGQRTSETAVAALAANQSGAFSRRQALAAGMTPRMIDRRLEWAQWRRCHPGVYVLAGAPATWHQRLWAAWLATGEAAVVSHRSAGVLWELDGCDRAPIELTLPGLGSRTIDGVTVHRAVKVRAADLTVRDGLPVTRPAATLVSLAAVLDQEALEDAHDSAVRGSLVTAAYLNRYLDRLGTRGRTGVGTLRAIVEDRSVWGLPGSKAERSLERLLTAAGVPRPVRQFELRDAKGVVMARFDLAWPDVRVAIEFHSFKHHAGRRPWRRDVGRRNGATAADWLVLFATQDDLDLGPQAPILSDLADALALRSA